MLPLFSNSALFLRSRATSTFAPSATENLPLFSVVFSEKPKVVFLFSALAWIFITEFSVVESVPSFESLTLSVALLAISPLNVAPFKFNSLLFVSFTAVFLPSIVLVNVAVPPLKVIVPAFTKSSIVEFTAPLNTIVPLFVAVPPLSKVAVLFTMVELSAVFVKVP